MKQARRSLKLEVDLWRNLEKLAAETESLAVRGPKSGKPSWRVLVRRIAQGELRVSGGSEETLH